MSCLTPEGALSGDCDFLSANMYARSLFGEYHILLQMLGILLIVPSGEDALANLSVERTEAGTITGHVRIRSKTQGIALSLGDRITMGTLLLCWFPWSIADVHLQRKRTTSLLYRFCCIERYNILDPLRLAQSPH